MFFPFVLYFADIYFYISFSSCRALLFFLLFLDFEVQLLDFYLLLKSLTFANSLFLSQRVAFSWDLILILLTIVSQISLGIHIDFFKTAFFHWHSTYSSSVKSLPVFKSADFTSASFTLTANIYSLKQTSCGGLLW